jgi:hypothetical protein
MTNIVTESLKRKKTSLEWQEMDNLLLAKEIKHIKAFDR